MLEGTIPSSVESRIIEFLGCLSAQQTFVLRVMSVIGTRGIESGLLEVYRVDSCNAPETLDTGFSDNIYIYIFFICPGGWIEMKHELTTLPPMCRVSF